MKARPFFLVMTLVGAFATVRPSAATEQPAQPMRAVEAFLAKVNAGGGKPIEQLTAAQARQVLRDAQAGAQLSPARVVSRSITTEHGALNLTIVRPLGTETQAVPAFMFFHGGGWVLGDFATHERLIRDLVTLSGAAAIYVDYTPSPEAHFPTAIHQAFDATQWVAKHGAEIGVDGTRLALVGNSVGGNMVAAVALQARAAGGPSLRYAVMLWPVTDARLDTASYQTYQSGYFLTKNMMRWFWDNYTTVPSERTSILASPINATAAQLKGFPPTLIQTAELDVLRDEGEAFGRHLDAAGVTVTVTRYNGVIHDFGLLNALSDDAPVKSALRQAGGELRQHLAK